MTIIKHKMSPEHTSSSKKYSHFFIKVKCFLIQNVARRFQENCTYYHQLAKTVSKIRSKAIKAIKKAEKEVIKPQLLRRLQCIRLKNKGWKHEEVSDFLGVRIETLSAWLKAYKNGGIKELLSWGYKGKESVLTDADKEKIKARHEEKPFRTAKEAKANTFQTFS